MSSLLSTLELLKTQFNTLKLSLKTDNITQKLVETLRVDWLGKKGHFTQCFDQLKNASKEERPMLGKALNDLRQFLEHELTALKTQADESELQKNLTRPRVDISLPVQLSLKGSLHPVTLMRQRLVDIFHKQGFGIYDGPEIDYDFYNFSALNIPEHHPARDMQDTFFVDHPDNLVLRTHTSNIQIHAMLREAPPLKLVALGRVYRVDNDATHTPMFHQIESVVVDRHINFSHLKGVIQNFTNELFGKSLKTRFRPSFFPFVEPGAEMDLQCALCFGSGCRVCKMTGWLEIGGCGMIHPNVFESVGYDSEEFSGFAFGFGIDRMAMLYYGLTDLRQLFSGDVGFLNQFPSL